MSAVTKERIVEVVQQFQAEHGRFPGVREVFAVTGGNYNRVAAMMNTLRPADDVDDIPVIPQAMIDVCATVLRWDALHHRTRALIEQKLPELEGQHSELLAAVNALKERQQALVADNAKLDAKRGALLLELNALQSEMRTVLMGVRPESAWETTYDTQPKL